MRVSKQKTPLFVAISASLIVMPAFTAEKATQTQAPISELIPEQSIEIAKESTDKVQLKAQDKNKEKLEHIEVFGQEIEHSEEKYDLNQSFSESYSRERIFSEQLDQDSVPDLKAALRGISNVRVTEQGAFSKKVSIRGLSGERVIYLIDGVKVPSQGLSHTGGAEGNLVDIGQVDFIEVVKGSPAVVYDPGAAGGIVNVHSKSFADKDFFKLDVRAGYDQGYDRKTIGLGVSGAKNGFFAGISASDNDTGGYLVENQEKVDEIIDRSNDLQERTDTEFAFTDLGFQAESQSGQLGYSHKHFGKLTVKYNNYQADDISFTHGAATSQIFHYDQLVRQSSQISYQTLAQQNLPITTIALTQSTMEKTQLANVTVVDTITFNLKSEINVEHGDYSFGVEYIADEAETNVNATMDYYAAYIAGQWYSDNWQFNAGVRYNNWQVEKQFSADENLTIRCQLAGSSGCLDPIDDNALTWSLATIYSVNESNNISINFSKTHRQPSLYERVAFDTFWGCHNDCDAEQANNGEISWKYFDQELFISASVFYSDFSSYLTTKEIRSIKPHAQAALNECIFYGLCNPLEGEFNDREAEFFSTGIKFFSIENVINQGAEFNLQWFIDDNWQMKFNASYNKLTSDSDWVDADSRPLELNGFVRYQWEQLSIAQLNYTPWAKFNMRYVTDMPTVKQREGFSAFTVADIYFGAEFEQININAGVRNIFNKVYHEPYGALDGLKRSVFISLNVSF
ncbi:MAG: TonB-dependent receptor [Colwellia sp.]|nr:TonB-dependent receptor [Colwellia sp.]